MLRSITLLSLLASLLTLLPSTHSLDNGLALTPPMGWLSWERYRCDIDCTNDPTSCISESLYKSMADHLSADGYLSVGYQYVNIDDCWAEKLRDFNTNQLVPDRKRFPSGMRALADYVHGKGLKLGIYGDWGTFTCGGYPGTLGYQEVDAQTFANWTIDSLKLDGCNANLDTYKYGYPNVSLALNSTGRPMLYACSWPAYYESSGKFNQTEWDLLSKYCNYWRNFDDINDDWESIVSIIEWWGEHQSVIAPIHGPGHFNDPDMVLCGDFALSIYECRAQFALWSIWAAPLYLSVDLRTIDPQAKAVITNKEVIAIDQDPLGKQGLRVSVVGCDAQGHNCAQSVWVKELANGDRGVVLFNRESYGMPQAIEAKWADLGLSAGSAWKVRDLWEGKDLGVYNGSFVGNVNTHEALIYRFSKVSQGEELRDEQVRGKKAWRLGTQ
jgi:alpha-N-acetylgalactosaminidase